MDDMDDIISEFLTESYESLDRLDLEFVELESDPASADLLASIFRTIHTIKGTAGFFAFSNLETVSHAGENLLSLLRDGHLALNVDMTNALLAMVDAIRAMLDVVSNTGTDGTESWSELTATLHHLADPDATPAGEAAPEQTSDAPVSEAPVPEAAVSEVADATDPAPADPAPEATAAEPAEARQGGDDSSASHGDASIRVDVKLLDRLMNLVGELVLARNQVLQFNASQGDPIFQGTSQQLDLITTELQEGVMQTRMQPIGNVWTKFPRIVRDLSTSLDKSVELQMIGKETELDKTLIEAIKDPLTHIVRNSVDHGIEMPADRLAAGKTETGTLTLRAFHEGGQVIIEISDDGGGLDLDKIRAKAISRGLMSEERARSLSDRDAANLIFQAGFSTADEVTNVSGRGVGMDVVRTNVERIGGTLDVQTKKGEGTTLTIKIPLTLAIIPALIITCNDDRYLIPQVNLVEVLHIEPDSKASLEQIGNAEVFRLRGTLLPIVHLRDVLELPRLADLDGLEADEQHQEGSVLDHDGRSIVVLQADGRQFGLVVDQINDTEEIVVKPLGPYLKDIDAFAGTTIMGDGAVSLILDAIGIARVSGVVREGQGGSAVDGDKKSDDRRDSVQTVLVARVGVDRVAIPLALVSRLEEFESTLVERAAGRDVIQYRGRLLNLISLRDVLQREPGPDDVDDPEALRVLVYESEENIYGFMVDEILDVFDADLTNAEQSTARGLAVSGVIGRRVTDLIDIDEILRLADQAPVAVLA